MNTYRLFLDEDSRRWTFSEMDACGKRTDLLQGEWKDDASDASFMNDMDRAEDMLDEVDEKIQAVLGFIPDYDVV